MSPLNLYPQYPMLKSERAFAAESGAETLAAGASWPCGSAVTYAVDPYCATSRVVTVPSRSAELPTHQHQPTK
jgi:hypothetical protein